MTAEAWEILGASKRVGGHQRAKYIGHDSASVEFYLDGSWYDHKTKAGGKGAPSAYAHRHGCTRAEALERLGIKRTVPPPLDLLVRHWAKALTPDDRAFIRAQWGLTDAQIQKARLGRITEDLPLGVTTDAARKVGLIKPDSSEVRGFRGYLAIPWIESGRAVSFSARRLPGTTWGQTKTGKEKAPKYLNPKGDRPWSFGTAPDTTKDGYIVEGYGDALAIGGPVRAVASNEARGDTIKQIADWGRHCLRLVLCLDGDEAGISGTEKTGRALLKAGALAYVATLPDGLDPAEHLKGDGSRESLSGSAVPFPAWLVHRLTVPQQCAEIASGLARLTKADRAVALGATVDAVVERFGMGKREARALLSNLRSINGGADERPQRDGDPTTLYGAVESGPHGYISHAADEPVLISGFTLTLTSILEMPNGDTVYRCAAHVAGEERGPLDLRMSAFADSRAFLAALKPIQSYGGTWTGSNAHVQGVLALLSQQAAELPRQIADRCLGWRWDAEGRPAWVTPHEVLGPGRDGVAWLNTREHLASRIAPDITAASPETCAEVVEAMWEVATPGTLAAPLICWAFGSLIAPVIRKHTRAGSFPALMLAGLQGGGKTTLAQHVVSRLSGWADQSVAPYMASGRAFGLLSVLTGTTGPVHIDEYDPRNLRESQLSTWEDWINLNYSGGVDMRGNRDRSIDEYRMASALCLSGETEPERPSIRERLVILRPPKDRLTAKSRDALRKLKGLPVQAVGRAWIEWALAQDFSAFNWEGNGNIARHYQWGQALPDRPRANLDALWLTLILLRAWLQGRATPLTSEQGGNALVDGYRLLAERVYGPQGRETELDAAVRAAAQFFGRGLSEDDVSLSSDGAELRLHIPSVRHVWATEMRRVGGRTPPETSVLMHALKDGEGQGYVVAASKTARVGAGLRRTRKCAVLSVDAIREALRIDPDEWAADHG